MAREARRKPVRWRFWLRAAFWLAVGVSTAVAARQATRFAGQDPLFILPAANTPCFIIDGMTHGSRERVAEVFAGDFGRSVFRVPLGERRRRLLAIDWVEDAVVSRVWPNRIWVRIRERTPEAFVRLPQGRTGSRLALIDRNGVILSLPPKSKFSFPIVTGLTEEQPESVRAARVRYVLQVEREIGAAARQISEIHLSPDDEVALTVPVDGRAVELLVGDRNFGSRYRNFINAYPEIRKRSPRARLFDLRLDDRITARNGG